METGGGDCVSRGAGQDLVAVVFEVHGRVQGVFFRVHTQEHAQHLGLTGWVQNMPGGTVKGEAEGPSAQVEKMLHWLRHIGSPQSRIDQLDILEKKSIAQRNYSSFEIIRKKRA
ncbi:acylphosphatase family protein [Toxoplasma gondii ARI]|uniref:Acylphosphatase n=1 Tax=Toxoplasma gondii ARI TaxID=1074872 RepID=A0A139XSC5_TOXGO|nr:acylphosphatase family protein [Toxoplasma gondii ARI]